MRDPREYRTTALRCKVARARAATLTQSVPFRRKYFIGLVSVTSALLLHSRAHCVKIKNRGMGRDATKNSEDALMDLHTPGAAKSSRSRSQIECGQFGESLF